MHVLSKGLFC